MCGEVFNVAVQYKTNPVSSFPGFWKKPFSEMMHVANINNMWKLIPTVTTHYDPFSFANPLLNIR